jgi:predicted deacylase
MAALPGMKEKGWLEFKYQNTSEPIRFPVGTLHGTSDGPTLAVVGGMHGSEFAGIEAAIRLFNEVDPLLLRGTLKVCMIYNLPAFVNHLGFLIPHDGKNPMRTFPGSPIGTYGEAMAYYFTHEFLSKADYMVELHGGDIPESLTPFTIHPTTGDSEVDDKSKAMSVAYNIPLVVAGKANDPANPLRSAFGTTALRGKPTILCESGQQGILNMAEVETHLVGLRNVLIHLNMLPGQITNTVKRTFIADYTAIRSEIDGMWYPSVQLNDMVKKDQVVGRIRDYFGEDLLEIRAQLDGIVTVVRTSPAIKVGNVLIEHGRVVGCEE